MFRTLPLSLFLLLSLPTSGHAATWSSIGTKDKARLEIDSGSIVKGEDGKLRAWHREVYASPKLPDSGAFSFSRLTMLTEFNCEKRTAAAIQHVYARADGAELKTENFDVREVKPVTPDSALESVFSRVCKTVEKKAVVEAKPAPATPAPAPVAETKDVAKKSKSSKKEKEEPPPHVTPHWTYSGETGAEKWGALGTEFATCSLGHRQSPIDIRRTVKADLPPIEFAYKPVPLTIVDNGHSIKVDTPGAGSITVEGESYDLVQFHFHKPSEEKINGKTYDMVVHLVHQSKAGKLAVVAVMMEAGKEQSLIRTLWTHLPLEQEKPATHEDVKINPLKLIPPKQQGYYTFLGSLTTPPCSEGVLWLVMKTPIQVSKEQLAGFGTVYKSNVRPIQPVNGRIIKESR